LIDLIHPEDMAGAEEMFEHFALGSEPSGVNTRYRCKDGSWRRVEWTARMAPDTGLIFGAGRDVTAHHEAQSALRDNEARLRAILDHSTAAVFVKDRQARYVLVNDAFLRPLGVEADEVIGRTAQEVWPGHPIDDRDALVLEQGETFTRDDIVDLPDGVRTVVTVRFPLRDAAGAVVGMAGIATDITDRIRAESALTERQRLHETVVRACPDIVTVLDGEGRVQEISVASRHILGYDLDDPVHEEVEALVHPDDIGAVYDEYLKAFSVRGGSLDVRYRVRHADGRWLVLDTRGRAIVGDDGKVLGAVIVSRDVTADLEVEAELRAAVEAAEQASTAKSEFLSRMSHELRTPLNAVLGFAQLLEMDELPDRQGEAVGHIMRGGRHLLNLIDEVLDIARIESGNLELTLEPVSVVDVMADAVDLTQPLAEHREVDIALDTASCEPDTHVFADRQRLLQVLLNLMSNAVKYNRPSGRVDVSIEPGGARRVRITVADTGIGIGAQDIDRVFEPFDRLGAEQNGVEGTGVGLTLSRHLVEHMGATISVRSVLGEGATFTVELPVAPAPRTVSPSGESAPISGILDGSLRVLHVEDNLANLELVEQILTRCGVAELYAAMSGSLGLELAFEHRPDLVLLDLHLPDMSGLELLRSLRADPRTADTSVVVVTADATPDQVERLHRSGVRAYLTKPIDVRELLKVVESVSTEGRARS
jgi:PAS domain S-box-containing protein